jgi:hypothetical protein
MRVAVRVTAALPLAGRVTAPVSEMSASTLEAQLTWTPSSPVVGSPTSRVTPEAESPGA